MINVDDSSGFNCEHLFNFIIANELDEVCDFVKSEKIDINSIRFLSFIHSMRVLQDQIKKFLQITSDLHTIALME